jgi:peptidyl-prolyl cis-trans isomerase B (cyclophilin B)
MARTAALIGLSVLTSCVLLVSGPGALAAVRAPSGCSTVSAPKKATRSEPPPTTKLAPGRNYDVTFQTNCGSFTIRLDQAQSPNAAASFASLVVHGFFDRTIFHRIAVGFVIQGGDPTQTGNGGPGYATVDAPPADAAYTHGVVAMAKSESQPPGTAGSQFFIVTEPDAGLTPDYAIVGKVIAGLPVVDRIGKLGNQAEQPTAVVEIESAKLAGPPVLEAAKGGTNWWPVGGVMVVAIALLAGAGLVLIRRRRPRDGT